MDARWTEKGEELFFGYKDHVKCDSESKIITAFSVTGVSVHDSQEFVGLIDEKDRDVKVDGAYIGDYADEFLRLFLGVRVQVCFRAFRNKSLREEEKMGNGLIVRVRAWVGYVFGYVTWFMVGIFCRVHGLGRVCWEVACMNLVHNL